MNLKIFDICRLTALQTEVSYKQQISNKPKFTILADESTDAGNKEHLTIVFRWVDEMLLVHEDFVGLHEIDNTRVLLVSWE